LKYILLVNRNFTYAGYGSSRKALVAAKAYRDKMAVEHDKKIMIAGKRSPKTISDNNISGVIGVHMTSTTRKNGETYYSWEASWRSGEGAKRKPKRRRFAILEYGNDKAFSLAVSARKEGIAQD